MKRGNRILISGAGVAGLTAAIWLGRAGFRPVVVERAQDVRADGYIISLSNRSYAYARELGVLEEVKAVAAGIRQSAYYNRGGRAMLELDYEALFRGLDIVQVMRDDLQKVLYAAAREVAEFRFDDSLATLSSLGNGADVDFESGRQASFDVVIGADGLHSKTRELAWPDSAVGQHFLGLFSAAYRLPNVLGLSQRFENHMERHRYMCVYTTRAGDLACVFIWRRTDAQAPPTHARQQILREDFVGAPTVVEKVLEHCPSDGIYMDNLIQIKMTQWSRGPVVLLGDAAHCMTLLSGQGASAAFWGASVLSKALIEGDRASAFAALEAQLKPVIEVKQPATLQAAQWYIPGGHLRYRMRDAAMTLLPNAFFQKYFARKYSSA